MDGDPRLTDLVHASPAAPQDFEALLELAEKMNAERIDLTHKARRARFAIAASLLLFSLIVLSFGLNAEYGAGAAALALLLPFCGLAVSVPHLGRLRRELAETSRAFSEVASLVREALPVMASAHSWSLLRDAQYRIRISRLGI